VVCAAFAVALDPHRGDEDVQSGMPCGRLLDLGPIDATEVHRRTAFGQQRAGRPADPAASAGDEGDLAGQLTQKKTPSRGRCSSGTNDVIDEGEPGLTVVAAQRRRGQV